MALHLPIGPLKTCSGLELVPRCEPSTYQPISQCLSHYPIGAGDGDIKLHTVAQTTKNVEKIHTKQEREREREMFYLMMHSTHFIYGYMASAIWLRTILIVRKETRCCHIGYSY